MPKYRAEESLEALHEKKLAIEQAQDGRDSVVMRNMMTGQFEEASDLLPDEFFDDGASERNLRMREEVQNFRRKYGVNF